MKDLFGSPGKLSGLLLRIGQCLFASASVCVMASASGFSTTTAFCYLIASMGLQFLWSFGLACLDIHALRLKKDLHSHLLVSLFVVGDWMISWRSLRKLVPWIVNKKKLPVISVLSLAATCASAGVVILLSRDTKFCQVEKQLACSMFNISIAFAFIAWSLLAISSFVMFWLMASV